MNEIKSIRFIRTKDSEIVMQEASCKTLATVENSTIKEKMIHDAC